MPNFYVDLRLKSLVILNFRIRMMENQLQEPTIKYLFKRITKTANGVYHF